jgi:CheY-like chemotaxis protein
MKLTEARILVVDDEPVLLAIFAKWLVAIGCRKVFTAADGEAALVLMQHESIDLLLTDVRMPVMDGITLVRRLGEIGSTLPSIVFVSGFGDVDRREMYALGVEAFIAKPFDRKELLSVLDKAVAERSTLWHTEMAAAPRQALLIKANHMDTTASPETIGLGRGGVSVCSSEPVSPGKIAFRLLLTDSSIEIVGQGFVRWASRIDCKAGIEIFFLDRAGRAWLTEAIDNALPRSFIPAA